MYVCRKLSTVWMSLNRRDDALFEPISIRRPFVMATETCTLGIQDVLHFDYYCRLGLRYSIAVYQAPTHHDTSFLPLV